MFLAVSLVMTQALPGNQSQAARRNNGYRNNNNNQNQQNAQQNAQNAANARIKAENLAAVQAAQAQLNTATDDVAKARSALEAVVGPLKEKFEATPEMMAAMAALADAQAARDKAQAAVDQRLQNDAGYALALKHKQDAVSQLDEIEETQGATQQQIVDAATAVLTAGSAVTQIQAQYENADSNYVQTGTALATAEAKVTALEKQFEESIKTNQQWVDAKKALDDAEAKLTEAQNTLAAAQAKLG